jgi:Cu+-exporting ATPase
VGSPALFAELSLPVPAVLRRATEDAEEAGQTAVLAGWDGAARAVLVVADALRPGSADAVARLQQLGLRTVLLTGDSERTARAVAGKLGVPAGDVFARVRPEGKAEAIRRLQADGWPAAMVGDGVNDAAALAGADLGMAIGSGTDAAIGAADLTLVSGDPGAIPEAVRLARATLAVIRANLTWAFGYNVIAIPLAALGYLNPLFAGIAMSASSLIVTSNSLRLRRFGSRPGGPRRPSSSPAARPIPTAGAAATAGPSR